VVIGGTAMSGGRGRIMGTLYGTLTLGIINNMMNLMGFPSFLAGAIQGAISNHCSFVATVPVTGQSRSSAVNLL